MSTEREGVAREHGEADLCLHMLLRGPLEPDMVTGKHCSREVQLFAPLSLTSCQL